MSYKGKDNREYVVGMCRYSETTNVDWLSTHLYDGTFGDPGLPLCRYGWNRMPYDYSYSIWRGQVSKKGICKLCKKRADMGLDGVKIDHEEEALRAFHRWAQQDYDKQTKR